MGKVVSIFRGQFLRDYIARQQGFDFFTDGLFVLGVLVTFVVPQVFYCAYGGPVSPWQLLAIAQAGVIVGLVTYIRPPAPVQSIVETQTVSQGDRTRRRKRS